ncbi:hypothetical protein HNP55_001885 [Paucibacter oligotrophus]|uniref:Rubrerythrin n=1 Tax=Roseateles oligotrophus TaxID=1769250 RepID=A0A840L5R5_9BURK|nr:3-oxoacyl-ACP synthase [Roseateles oligotrophus]MBB4843366.1 hypothetical protein [Roseateles oligotrophus]
MAEGLGPAQRQDLADLLPFLACGEESAAHVFGGSLLAALPAAMGPTLQGIAADERRHAALLEHLQRLLPRPRERIGSGQLAFFFKRLQTPRAEEHLARVAALDLAVCRLLQPLLRRGAGLAAAPLLHQALCRLRRDEARHVRLARGLAFQLGCSPQRQAELNQQLGARLDALLAPVRPSLQALAQVREA